MPAHPHIHASDPAISEPEVLVAPAVDPALREALLTQVEERGQVTVHCRISTDEGDMVRIWPHTYLVCKRTRHRSELLHAEGIPFAPHWMPVLPGHTATFTLVFAALPDECMAFDLVEEIPEPGGFHVAGIPRNGRDLYNVEL
ncbi:MAG: hypothetical protein JNM31_05795 [Flavobacteriales bacterium]|nr:hypothetical protein [Flavobacteriales bacterium]